jgi:3-oxoadipate enol-lactonase/4-carboxymuconolactone decarboxylase
VTVTAVRLGGRPDLPLLVLGPSLGTSATALWGEAARELAQDFQVVAWDLPGHGYNRGPLQDPVSVAGLAADVLAVVDELSGTIHRGAFHYAGDSVGGAVGLQLLLDAPHRVLSATLLCTGARIGTPELWRERIATVRASGTPALTTASAQRWFAPGFLEREPQRGSALLHALSDADDAAYVAVCGALADFDVRARLGEITAPVLAVAGEKDVATPPQALREIAHGVRDGRLVVLPDVAHLAPVEAPTTVARLITQHVKGPSRDERTVAEVRAEGMAVRREVLGDAHVDRAGAQTTDLTRDFQRFITEYAWGGVWARPGLDRRSRSLITITALVARGHHEELALHLRAALGNGLTVEEISEVLLQTAIYCGVPDANAAFRVARQVFEEPPP